MKHRFLNRMLSLALAAAVTVGAAPAVLAAGETAGLTRGEARDMLLAAADDYNPGVTAEDILQGDPSGDLREDEIVTRAEALVMLSRAFGELPAPAGDSARWAYSADNFTDVPAWAGEELANVFAAGIVAGTSATTFSPRDPVTAQQLTLFIQRVYALEGSNLKDDFYAAVNKDWLDSSIIQPGYSLNSTLNEITYDTNAQVAALIREIAAGNPTSGSAEDKIKTLYDNILNWDARNEAGVEPLQDYLDAIDAAATLDELMAVHNRIMKETSVGLLLGFGITIDLADTSKKVLFFGTMGASLPQEYYANDAVVALFTQYIATLLTLGGEDEESALAVAAALVEVEKALSAVSLTSEQKTDLANTYNIYDMDDLRALFPTVDLDAVRETFGLPERDTCVVSDPGLVKAVGELLTEENVDQLKAIMKINLLSSLGTLLNREFSDAANAFDAALTGTAGALSDEETAAAQVQAYLSDYLGRVYVEEHFSAEAKADVEAMIDDILAAYETRIGDLEWMSEATKAKAVEKLEAITVNVGYPDQWSDPYKDVDFLTVAEGGSFYDNVMAMARAALAKQIAEFDEPVDKTGFTFPTYMVNAAYDAAANSINFPAGILQAPLYDVEASYEENLGGIGYIIAHEITHAFDNTGAQFDAQGNQSNWWTDEDYAAFQALCAQVVEFYDGVEAIPGVRCNGALTLGENVADLGALACITQITAQQDDPDFETLYRSAARTWRSAASREMREYLATLDVHAPDKLRGNRALQSLDQFYDTFDIQPGDGMWLAPEDRVQVW